MKLNDAKILICDDSILARKQIIDFILSYGKPVFIEAANGQEAVDKYKRESPDLVFLDIVMPIKDGNAAIREIKESNPHSDIIVVTSVGTQSQIKAAIEAGANDFIQKPIYEKHIHSVIASRFEIEGR